MLALRSEFQSKCCMHYIAGTFSAGITNSRTIPPPHSGRRTEDTSSVYAERCARSLKYARSKKNKHRIFLTGKKIKINTQAFIVACKQMQMKRESANLLYMPTRRFPVYTHTHVTIMLYEMQRISHFPHLSDLPPLPIRHTHILA